MDDSLSFESFLRGARKAAHKAMEAHGRGEYDDFALQGGVAIEKLAKAVLVSKNPVYLLDMNRGSADLLLYFGGHLDMEATKIRTVGARDAIQRLRKLGVLPPSEKLDELIELRNGTAHASNGEGAKSMIPPLAENVAILLAEVGVAIDGFWGRWESTVSAALDRRKSEIERDVQIRMAQAKHHYDDRFSDLPDHLHRRLVVEQFSRINVSVSETEAGIWIEGENVCPACDCVADALAVGQSAGEASPVSVFALKCHLCRLQLATREELAAAGMDLETVDERLAARAARYLGGSEISNVAFRRKVAQFLHSDLDDWE